MSARRFLFNHGADKLERFGYFIAGPWLRASEWCRQRYFEEAKK